MKFDYENAALTTFIALLYLFAIPLGLGFIYLICLKLGLWVVPLFTFLGVAFYLGGTHRV